MYTPSHFEVDDDTAASFLASVRAADLVTVTDTGLMATYLPLLYDLEAGECGGYVGHLARANPQWKTPARGEAMLIARGPDAYITPSWYAGSAEHGRMVPTWNYATAHIHGELVIHDDVEWLGRHVRRLTDRQEDGRERPWSVDDAPADYIAGQLRAIVGVELLITRVELTYKMSQNRPDADIDGVVAGLDEDGLIDVADLVRASRR